LRSGIVKGKEKGGKKKEIREGNRKEEKEGKLSLKLIIFYTHYIIMTLVSSAISRELCGPDIVTILQTHLSIPQQRVALPTRQTWSCASNWQRKSWQD
jgi:hypothetical protein